MTLVTNDPHDNTAGCCLLPLLVTVSELKLREVRDSAPHSQLIRGRTFLEPLSEAPGGIRVFMIHSANYLLALSQFEVGKLSDAPGDQE